MILIQISSEICESITEDENLEIETDTCSIVVKKYLLDEENEYKCTIYGEDYDENESTSTSVSKTFLLKYLKRYIDVMISDINE